MWIEPGPGRINDYHKPSIGSFAYTVCTGSVVCLKVLCRFSLRHLWYHSERITRGFANIENPAGVSYTSTVNGHFYNLFFYLKIAYMIMILEHKRLDMAVFVVTQVTLVSFSSKAMFRNISLFTVRTFDCNKTRHRTHMKTIRYFLSSHHTSDLLPGCGLVCRNTLPYQ